jgi:uncharacterized protein (DUF433 family)
MAESSAERITTDLMREPHIAGRRISVLHIFDWVEGRGLSPQTVADRFDLDIADVYAALAYYHDNPAEMKALREDRKQAFKTAQDRAAADRPPGVDPGA